MFEKFTERARKAMSLSRQEAQRLNCEFIGTEHILLALMQDDGGVAAKALARFKVDLPRLRQSIVQLVTPPTTPPLTLGQLPFSPRAKRLLEIACEQASAAGTDVVGTGHLLIACVAEDEGIAAKVLRSFDVNVLPLQKMVLEMEREVQSPPPPPDAARTRIRVAFYTKGGDARAAVWVSGVKHTEADALSLDGVLRTEIGATAAALAAQRGCQVYVVEDLGSA